MIEISRLTFKYESADKNALSELTLDISDGAFIGLTGPGGSGKTTLLYSMCGVVPHYIKGDFYGSVVVGGMDTVNTSPLEIAKTAGLVMQDTDSQFIAAVVEDELLFGLENFGVPHDEIESRLDEVMTETGITELRYRLIRQLSGGQKRKVAIAAILALRPRLLLLDEPTGELDPPSKRQVFQTLKTLNQRLGLTIVVSEKNVPLLAEFTDKILVMENGNVKV
jgi:energy-coupling factor transport system ATP-binding protein